MINDHSKTFVVRSLLVNDRLKAYRDYIGYARQKDYQILSLEKFYELAERRGGYKHFILRHDVDWSGHSTRRMFELERELGVTSTYYFRFSTIDKTLIQEMRESGFDVGLHFETIADYIKEKGCKDRSEIDLEEVKRRFMEDISRFEDIVGFKTVSCCSHGDPINKLFGISNNVITEDEDMNRYGLAFEAYDKQMYEADIDCHIMDGNMLKNYGFQYQDNPRSAIDKSFQNIVFLSHPHNWDMDAVSRLKFLRAYMLGKATFESNRSFQRIAK